MAEIDYRDVPAPGMGVGAGMMRAMRRSEPAPLRLVGAKADARADRGNPAATYRREAPAAAAAVQAATGMPRGERMQRLVNGAGALVSVLLVAGLAWWGYRIAVRDVTGIPVIRALEGPSRVAPDDPGGELARHQGLSVNDVTADGAAAPAPDRLVLAPRPEGLSEDDLAMSALAEGAGAAGAALSIEPADATAMTEPLTGQPLGPDGAITDPALAPAMDGAPGTAEPRPIPRPGTRAATLAAASGLSGQAADSGVEDADIAAALAAAEASITPQETVELDPASLASGTRLVQIDTYDSVDSARAGWDAIAAAFPDVMTGKRRVIEPAGSDGTSFFRLRAEGFTDVEDARRFCSVLLARVPTCVPALVR
jgi:hypothetical protein